MQLSKSTEFHHSQKIVPVMKIEFEPMGLSHRKEVMDIYNYYVANSFAAYPDTTLPYEFYDKLLMMTKAYPAFVLKSAEHVVGFCFLHPHNPYPSFNECAEVTYFIANEYTGQGFGKKALQKLEAEAKEKGIRILLASIASENQQSLAFHQRNGFTICGRFKEVIKKNGKRFDIVWMQKWI